MRYYHNVKKIKTVKQLILHVFNKIKGYKEHSSMYTNTGFRENTPKNKLCQSDKTKRKQRKMTIVNT